LSKEITKKALVLVLLALVLALTGAVYFDAPRFGFIHLDDFDYVIENPYVKSGLTLRNVKWAFSSFYACNWHPLTWLSHMLDCELYGLDPMGHHLTNLIFHLASTAVLFLLLHLATGSLYRSAFIAAVFGVHPLHVESVAWISERKDVLSAFFWMCSLLCYVSYARRGGKARYLLAAAFFILGLMSKQMLITLPFVMLLMDFWPLERLKSLPLRKLLTEKIPFFTLTLAGALVAFLAQHLGGATASFDALPLLPRLQNAAVSYFIYTFKTAFPTGLGVYYPLIGPPPLWQAAAALTALAGITAAAFIAAKRLPYLTTGWLWYTGTLVPVIGIVQIGGQAYADRYTYLPMIGLLMIAAWGGNHLSRRLRIPNKIQFAVASIALIALTAAGNRQASYWKDSITLFERTISVTGNNWMAYNSLGSALKDAGRLDEAIASYRKSIGIKPGFREAHNNMGVALTAAGRTQEAEQSFRTALQIEPEYAEALDNLGVVLAQQGRPSEGLQYVKKALEIKPLNAKAHNNMGNVMTMLGRKEEAVKHYNQALSIDPTHRGARQNLDRLLRESQPPAGSPFRRGPG
jgi:Flp pilus assembly protein TadD